MTERSLINLEVFSMKGMRFAATLMVILGLSLPAIASDPVGIYAVVDRVVLEPNDTAPERIQIWGAFSLATGRGETYESPVRGYMYYALDKNQPDASKKEFADLKRIAGTSQCVGFGGRYIPTGRIRKPEEKPASPDAYPIGFGMQKMRVDTSNPAVKELLALRRS
jgi:hypothetical protein